MRLLLAEDEKELSNALCAILEHNNYSVDAVYNGLDALEYLTGSDKYDAAILDIMMPGMDGITALKKARAQGCSIPVIMLTARTEVDDRVEGLDSGADDYMPKPFSTKELLARIRALTRRREEITGNTLTVGNLSLDRLTSNLSTPNGSIKLANKEFQMMEMFMNNPGRIIPIDEFMDRIWGWDAEAETNVVWVNISYLRKKLTSLGSTASIRVSRGVGYSLEV